MYAFVANGETKKRDLNTGDIEGIQSLYGANAVTASQISSGIGAAIESAFDGRPFDTLPEDAPPVGETPSGPPSFEQLPEDAPPVEHLPQFAPSHTNEDTIDLVMFHGKSNGTLDELFGTDELFGGLA